MIELERRMAAAKAASKSASEAANGDSVKTEMAVVDKGGGVVEMVPHDEDGQVRREQRLPFFYLNSRKSTGKL